MDPYGSYGSSFQASGNTDAISEFMMGTNFSTGCVNVLANLS
jgi:hypothetical protein